MEHSDILLTLAEVGIAFAGFTGLAAVFGSARAGVDPSVHYARFRSMIESALLLVIFSMAPLMVATSQLHSDAVWRLSGLLFASAWLFQTLVVLARLRRLALGVAAFNRLLSAVLVGGALVAQGALFASAAGIFPASTGSIYVVGLAWLLVHSAIVFLRVLLVFVPDGGDRAE